MDTVQATTVRTFTDAPEDYDGFGTRTLRIVGRTIDKGRLVREVETPEEHANWQRLRYASGWYMHADNSGFRNLASGPYPLVDLAIELP